MGGSIIAASWANAFYTPIAVCKSSVGLCRRKCSAVESGPPTHSKHYRAISFDFLGWHFRLTSSMSFSISRLTLSKTLSPTLSILRNKTYGDVEIWFDNVWVVGGVLRGLQTEWGSAIRANQTKSETFKFPTPELWVGGHDGCWLLRPGKVRFVDVCPISKIDLF